MLEGRLDDLSLPDLFQLLALTNKTGTLRMRYGDTAGAVIFRDGQIVGAFDDVRRTAPGTRMLAAGLIDDADLEAALEATEHRDEGGVIAALVAQGAIDETAVAEFRRQQAEDAVFALMRLSEATFSLETGEVPPLAGEVELNTEQLVVEGGRRLSEWAEIRRRVPGRQSVPSLVPDPPGEGPVTVGRQQWRLLALVDGRRTVGDVVDLLGSGEYATSAELSGLVDAGLVSVGDRATHAAGVRTRGDRLRELETRELGLLRDDPTETPETVAADASAQDDDEDDAAAEAGADEAVAADEGDASGDETDAGTDDEAGDDTETAAEEPAASETSRPTARRSTLAPTLISGVELGDDVLTAGEPLNGDDATVPDASDVAAEALGSAVPSAHEEDEAGEPTASDDADEPEEAEEADEPEEPDEAAGGPAPLPAAPPQPTGGEPASTSAEPEPAEQPTAAAPASGQQSADSAPADGSARRQPPLGNELPAAPGARPAEQANGDTVWVDDDEEAEKPPQRRLTRDEDINKAMLLRLIDGVKGV